MIRRSRVRRRDPHVDGCMCTFCKHHRYRDRQLETQELAIDVMREAVDTMKKLARRVDEGPGDLHTGPIYPTPPAVATGVDAEFDIRRPRTPGECPKDSTVISQFEMELANLINKYNLERETNIPDWILAGYIVRSMEAFRHTVVRTHNWYAGSRWENPSNSRPTPRDSNV
jgi:hypothetical protein